jgi:hypothetical protein
VDAELTTGKRTPLDPALSADGVDEALRVMFGGDVPAWGMFAADEGRTVRIVAVDTGDFWMIKVGLFTGTDPDDGRTYDEKSIQVVEADAGEEPAATISGDAADLDCSLWGRPGLGQVDRSGSHALLAEFDEIVTRGVN